MIFRPGAVVKSARENAFVLGDLFGIEDAAADGIWEAQIS